MPWDPIRPTTLDDSGRRVPVVTARALFHDERRADPAFQHIIEQVTRVIVADRSNLGYGVVVAGSVIAINVLCVFALPGMGWVFRIAILVALVYPVIWAGNAWIAKRGAGGVASVVLADGICPACAYNLAAQLADGQGLVHCPECDAAWRSDRIFRRHLELTERPNRKQGFLQILFAGIIRSDQASGPKSITDDRGRTRPIIATRLAVPLSAATGDRKARLAKARDEIRRQGRVGRQGRAGCLAVFFLGMAAVILSTAIARGVALQWSPGLFLVVFGVLMPVMILRGSAGIDEQHIRTAMLRNDLCPSCAADLAESVSEFGSRLCTGCGASWNVSPPPADPPTIPPPDNCPRCRYPLAGLQPDARGGIVCPECATEIPLTARAQARALARCPDCQASLAGRTLRSDGQINCQRCGTWTSHCNQQILDLAAMPELEVEG